MITIITGQPGNGKTLFSLWKIEQQRIAESREVYFWNVRGLSLPWHPAGDASTFDRRKDGVEPDVSVISRWWELPSGSIIFMDEAQIIFRPRPRGQHAEVITQLETHRKGGFDIYICTQHPQLIDTAVRKLANRHIHISRKFGRETAKLYQWEDVRDPSSEKDKKDALVTGWKFPREVYGWYKSAELHTVKKDFPIRKVVFLVAGIVFVIGIALYILNHVRTSGIRERRVSDGEQIIAADRSEMRPVRMMPAIWDATARTPRVLGVPESAPMYDHLQVVRSMPAARACMIEYGEADTVRGCTCWTEQRTIADVTLQQCVDNVTKGIFDPRLPAYVPRNTEQAEGRSEFSSPADAASISVAPATPTASVGMFTPSQNPP